MPLSRQSDVTELHMYLDIPLQAFPYVVVSPSQLESIPLIVRKFTASVPIPHQRCQVA